MTRHFTGKAHTLSVVVFFAAVITLLAIPTSMGQVRSVRQGSVQSPVVSAPSIVPTADTGRRGTPETTHAW